MGLGMFSFCWMRKVKSKNAVNPPFHGISLTKPSSGVCAQLPTAVLNLSLCVRLCGRVFKLSHNRWQVF